MAKPRILLFLLIISLLSACGIANKTQQTNLYGPALYKSDIAYLPKPLSSDQKHYANYLSAALAEGTPTTSTNSNDELTSGELSFGQGFTFKNFNLAYDVFGVAGSYSNQTDPETNMYYFNNKSFGAFGVRFSANGYISTGRVDIRYFGFEMTYSHEFGDYADYRKIVTNQPYFYTNTATDLVTIGGTSEVAWHSHKQDIQFGIRLFLGEALNGNEFKNQGRSAPFYNGHAQTISVAYFMQLHRYFLVGEANSVGGGRLRLGLKF